MSITGVRAIHYNVTNMPSSIHFYRDLLGLVLESAEDGFTVVRAGNSRIGLNEKPSPIPSIPFDANGAHCGGTLSLQVVGMERLVENLRRHDVRFLTDVERNAWGDMVVFQDPDGNILKLFEVKI
ncbi:Glyoxalase/Bleomycin resistance protein/Dihydroxybiphenyl dioxygenase [Chytridium lagenaria]|nr:Glyoxalase/Bleomycin resistance protein/Dihydroxybiphenyl dioxygenase [Chytridium lagenaria]